MDLHANRLTVHQCSQVCCVLFDRIQINAKYSERSTFYGRNWPLMFCFSAHQKRLMFANLCRSNWSPSIYGWHETLSRKRRTIAGSHRGNVHWHATSPYSPWNGLLFHLWSAWMCMFTRTPLPRPSRLWWGDCSVIAAAYMRRCATVISACLSSIVNR